MGTGTNFGYQMGTGTGVVEFVHGCESGYQSQYLGGYGYKYGMGTRVHVLDVVRVLDLVPGYGYRY